MAEWLPERIPEDPEAERALLATCCAPGAELLAAELAFSAVPEDFMVPKHRSLFRALFALVNDRQEINPLTLKDQMDRDKTLDQAGGYSGLVELLGAEEVGNPRRLLEILQDKHKGRQLIRLGAQLVRAAAQEEDTPDMLVQRLSAALMVLVQRGDHKRKTVHVSEITDDVLAGILDQMEGKRESGVRVGFPRLDRMTRGFSKTGFIVLAARPGIGKTALALNWALRSAAKFGTTVAFFSLEMSRDEVVHRLIAAQGKLDLKEIMAGGYNDLAIQEIVKAKAVIDELPLYINDQATITVQEIMAACERLMIQSEGKLGLVIVDYLQLVKKPDGNKRTDASLVSDITRTFKLSAKEMNIPFVVLSQLNREVESRQNGKGRPILSDLRDSGSIEQDADMVMFIHRNAKPSLEAEAPDGSGELIIAKHRNGPVGVIPVFFEEKYTRFREVEGETADYQHQAKVAQPSLYQ